MPNECAFSSSPVLIVNHVTENRNLMIFGLLFLWLGFNSQHVVKDLRVFLFFVATLSSSAQRAGISYTEFFYRPGPEHVIFQSAM